MPQQILWYNRSEEGSKPTFKRRVQRGIQIISHPPDAWLVVRLLSWACLLPVLKRVVPLKKLAPFMWSSPGGSQDPDREQKIAAVVRWIYIFVFPDEKSCLERSLLLYRFLSRNKQDPRLVTGMRRTETGAWNGHAWIEVNGKPFEEKSSHIQDFRALIVFGPEGVMKQAEADSTEITQ